MLNKKDLRGNAALFRDVAQLLTVWADDLEATLTKKGKKAADAAVEAAPAASAPDTEKKAEVPAAADAPVVPVEKAAAEETALEPVPEPEPLTYVKVRGLLSGKSASGFRTQVIALINSYGAEKLSDVDPKHYPELVAAVERLGDNCA